MDSCYLIVKSMPKKVTDIHNVIVDEVPEFAYITKVWLDDSKTIIGPDVFL